MDLVLTDKGRKYLERISTEAESIVGNWDSLMLRYVDMYPSDEGLSEQVGRKGTEVIRRLFEEGYISY